MVFNVTFLASDSKIQDVNKENFSDIKKETNYSHLILKNELVAGLKIIKDPVEKKVTTYELSLVNLDKNLINLIKNNIIETIVIQIGRALSPIPNYNLLKLYIRPIRIRVNDPKKTTVNNITVIGIGAINYALMMDKSFSTNMEASVNEMDSIIQYNTPEQSTYKKKSAYHDISNVSNIPLNIRQNNPGNLIKTNINWQGEVGSSSNFEAFVSPEMGFRALALNLRTRIQKGSGILKDIISEWAPPHENDTQAYYQFVAKMTNLSIHDKVTEKDLADIAKAIAVFEGDNLGYFSDDMINEGMILAGFNSKVTNFKSGDEIIKDIERNQNFTTNKESINTYGSSSYLNPTQAKRGLDLLEHILTGLNSKYGILYLNNPITSGGVSNYLYKNLFTPNLNAYQLIDYVYEWYPPFYLNNPWLLDDAYYTDEESVKIGSTVFTPLNIFNIEGLPDSGQTIYSFINKISGNAITTDIFNITDKNLFYKDFDLYKLRSVSFNHKNLLDNVDTIIYPQDKNYKIQIPNINDDSGIESINKTIDITENINVETNYDASEFKKRLGFLDNHMVAGPELIRVRVRADDLNYFQFGKKYYFFQADINKENPMTPYKMAQIFENNGGFFKLEHEIIFLSNGKDMSTLV